MNVPSPYTLPTIDFVGGSTQDLLFHCYFHANRKPHDMSSCTANFSIIHFLNRNGAPLISKQMQIEVGSGQNAADGIKNTLRVTLEPTETVNLPDGKYIYQISIRDISGDMEIPNQGVIYLTNNINKGFVR